MAQRSNNLPINRKIIGAFQYYEDKVLGKGSNSIAYEGRRIGTNQSVCIKKISLRSPFIQKLAKTQIEVLKRVMHKNILKFIAHIEKGSFIYIVTQLCDMTLSDRLKKVGKFDDKFAVETFLQILEGYQQLRNNGYIHRDIKPQNLLIMRDSVRLADFGYSTLLRSQSFRENYNVGTPIYMSPQALTNNTYSQKSDIWSLGVTLYSIISGSSPFMSRDELSLRRQLKKPIKQLNCHPKVMKIIRNCLQYEAQKRIQLQALILQVKLVLNEINQRPYFSTQKLRLIWENQLNYIQFIEYVIILTSKCEQIDPNIKQRCLFLMQYIIRMRIDFLEKFKNQNENVFTSPQINKCYIKIKQLHSFQINLPQKMEENDRLYFFKDQKATLKHSLQWQTQAQIKNIVKNLLSQLLYIRDDYNTMLSDCKIKLVDFLITTFVLNKLLIQKENDSDFFLKQSQLGHILKSPCRVSYKTLQKIKAKAVLLRIM